MEQGRGSPWIPGLRKGSGCTQVDAVSALRLAAQPHAGHVPLTCAVYHPPEIAPGRLGWKCCGPGCSPSSITPHVSADRRPGSLSADPGPPLLVEQTGSAKTELGLRTHPSENLCSILFWTC